MIQHMQIMWLSLHSASAHGQVCVELAEPYYLYGKALLELARSSSSVLGSAIPGQLQLQLMHRCD